MNIEEKKKNYGEIMGKYSDDLEALILLNGIPRDNLKKLLEGQIVPYNGLFYVYFENTNLIYKSTSRNDLETKQRIYKNDRTKTRQDSNFIN